MTAPALPVAGRRAALRNVPVYAEIIRGRIRTVVAYRLNLFMALVILVMEILILQTVWRALYGYAGAVDGMTLSAMLGYLTIAGLQHWAMQDPSMGSYLAQRVREGQVSFDLVRPTAYVPQMLAHLTGSSVAMLMCALVALPVVAVVGVVRPPASWTAVALWLVSLLLGYAVAVLMSLIIGLTAFFTTEISGVAMLFYLVNQFFAGAMVPLSVFPGTLRVIAETMPFQATTYTPVSIYMGQLAGATAGLAMLRQAVWVLLLSAGVWLLWARAKRRVVVQGG